MAIRARRPLAGTDAGSRIPRYLQVASVLRRRIREGRWAIGQKMATLEELEREFGVARVTVRQAIADLVQAGTNVGEGEGGPVGEVAFGRGAVPGEVAQGKLGQGFDAVEPPRCRHAFGHEGVGVLAADD